MLGSSLPVVVPSLVNVNIKIENKAIFLKDRLEMGSLARNSFSQWNVPGSQYEDQ